MKKQSLFAWVSFFILVAAQSAFADVRVRIVAANITSGNAQSYDPGDGIRIFKGLKPDVVLIQEFRYGSNTPEDIRKFVDSAFGPAFHYHRESTDGDTNAPIPNGVISRYPIIAKGEWEDPIPKNRDFTWAKIDVPGNRDLWAISVHLKASSDSAAKRAQEAQSLVDLIRRNIPPQDYIVIGGDFNTSSRAERALEILKPVLWEPKAPLLSDAAPGTESVNPGTNMNGRSPYDWVLGNEALRAQQVPVRFPPAAGEDGGPLEFSTGLIFDSTKFERLSLVPGVSREDSRAPGMQHLAVVKDFVLPTKE